MRSKLLISAMTLFGMTVFVATSGNAFYAPPPLVMINKGMAPIKSVDVGRSVTGILQGVLVATQDGESKAQLIAVQEQINKNADGTGDETPNACSDGNLPEKSLKNGAYDYIKAQILDKTDLTTYGKLQTALSGSSKGAHAVSVCGELNWKEGGKGEETCQAVVDTFFAPTGATDREMERIQSQRQEYASTVVPRFIKLGYETQRKLKTDLQAAAIAPVSADNEIASIANDGQTLDEMLKITVADLALQVEMMEADAISFLLQQPVAMMPEEKPRNWSTQEN